MKEIRFCSFCGKILDSSFNYCPFCGTQNRDVIAFESIVDASLEKVEKVRMSNEIKRLEKLEDVLEKLENDLNLFLSVKSS